MAASIDQLSFSDGFAIPEDKMRELELEIWDSFMEAPYSFEEDFGQAQGPDSTTDDYLEESRARALEFLEKAFEKRNPDSSA